MFRFGVEVESEVAEFGAKLGGHLEALLGGEVQAESGSVACFVQSQARHDRIWGVARHGWILR